MVGDRFVVRPVLPRIRTHCWGSSAGGHTDPMRVGSGKIACTAG